MPDSSDFVKLYRTIIAVVAVYLLLTAAARFLEYSTSTTTGSSFRDTPGRLAVTRSISTIASADNNLTPSLDSLKAGDLLISLKDHTARDTSVVASILQAFPDSSVLEVRSFRTSEGKYDTSLVIKIALTDSAFALLPPTVFVDNIEPQGAAAVSGIQVGDLIYRINGRGFSGASEAASILERLEAPSSISFGIIRGGQRMQLILRLDSSRFRASVLALFLTGLVFFALGAFLSLSRPEIYAATTLGLSFLGLGFFLMMVSVEPSEVLSWTGIETFALFAALTFGLGCFAAAKFYFPPGDAVVDKKWLRNSPYALAGGAFLLLLIASWADLGTEQGRLVALVVAGAVLFLINIGLDLALYKRRSRGLQRITWILHTAMGTSLALVLVISLGLASDNLPGQMGFLGLPLVLIPSSYFYVIGRYQLLEVGLRFQRDVGYVVLTSIWVMSLVAIFFVIMSLLPGLSQYLPSLRWVDASLVIRAAEDNALGPGSGTQLLTILLAVGITLAIWRFGAAGQRVIDRRLNPPKYNISEANRELAEIMATNLTMSELAVGILQRIVKLMDLKRAGVMFFRDQRVCCCQEVLGFQQDDWDRLCLSAGDKLVTEIKKFRSEARFSTDYLPREIKEGFIEGGFRHVIPIRFKDKLVGTFIIGEKRSETPLLLEDLNFLAAVAQQASIAIENSFLHEELTEQERLKHELQIARRIQMASLPQTTPEIEGLEISGTSVPALEVGGDYFDYLNGIATSVTVIVGDVSGKGTSAALYMSKVQGIIRSLHPFNLSPRELFIRTNHLLCQDMERNSFITAISASIDTTGRNLVLARAGHLPLFYYNASSKQVELITPKGLGLGLDRADVFATELEEQVISYQAGDVFLFVTDGVTEAKTPDGGEFGEEKLAGILAESYGLSALAIRNRVVAAVSDFEAHTLPHDDQTVVVVKSVK